MKLFKAEQCPHCPAAEKNLKEVAKELKLKEEIEFVNISEDEGRIEALNNMVMSTPTLLFNGEIIHSDILLNKTELIKRMKR